MKIRYILTVNGHRVLDIYAPLDNCDAVKTTQEMAITCYKNQQGSAKLYELFAGEKPNNKTLIMEKQNPLLC